MAARGNFAKEQIKNKIKYVNQKLRLKIKF